MIVYAVTVGVIGLLIQVCSIFVYYKHQGHFILLVGIGQILILFSTQLSLSIHNEYAVPILIATAVSLVSTIVIVRKMWNEILD